MSKDAKRNEPCPCGSGKKYKKCCAMKTGMAKYSTSVIASGTNSLLERITESGKEMGMKLSGKNIAPISIDKKHKKD